MTGAGQRAAGGDADRSSGFLGLEPARQLPGETKNYVPGIIAAIIMAKNPEQYGLDKIVPDAPVVSDTVTVDYPIDLRLVADVTNASLLEIVTLNPSLLRMTTPRDMSFDLHIPVGTSEVFAAPHQQIFRKTNARVGVSMSSAAGRRWTVSRLLCMLMQVISPRQTD